MTQEVGLREVLAQINARFDAFERRMDSLERRMETSGRNAMANFRLTTGILIGTLFPMWITIILTIVFRT